MNNNASSSIERAKYILEDDFLTPEEIINGLKTLGIDIQLTDQEIKKCQTIPWSERTLKKVKSGEWRNGGGILGWAPPGRYNLFASNFLTDNKFVGRKIEFINNTDSIVKNLLLTTGYHFFLDKIIPISPYENGLHSDSIPSTSFHFGENFSSLYKGKKGEKVMDATTVIFFIAMTYIINKKRLDDRLYDKWTIDTKEIYCDIITSTGAYYKDCGGGFTRLPLTIRMGDLVCFFAGQGLNYSYKRNGGILLEAEPRLFFL